MINNSEKLMKEAQLVANDIPDFFKTNGYGKGNIITNNFMNDLRIRMSEILEKDYSEKKVSTENNFKVDYYFPSEGAIVEIALGLKRPNSEYEKDILKAIMAKENGFKVKKLIFISKTGGKKKCNQPARNSIAKWLKDKFDIKIRVWELNEN